MTPPRNKGSDADAPDLNSLDPELDVEEYRDPLEAEDSPNE